MNTIVIGSDRPLIQCTASQMLGWVANKAAAKTAAAAGNPRRRPSSQTRSTLRTCRSTLSAWYPPAC